MIFILALLGLSLAALATMGPDPMALFLRHHLQDVGLVLLTLAILSFWFARFIESMARYIWWLSVVYLVVIHYDFIFGWLRDLAHVF